MAKNVDFCVDENGQVVDEITPEETTRIVHDAVEHGRIVFAVMQHKEHLMVKAFMPPTQELLDSMENAITVLRGMLAENRPAFPQALRRRES